MPRVDIDEDELKARNVPHLAADTITIRGGDPDQTAAVRAYLEENRDRFADPEFDDSGLQLCVACRRNISHTFTWGIVHGIGNCSDCGWPHRLYHYVDVGQERDLRISALLAYHPDQVLTDEEDADAQG